MLLSSLLAPELLVYTEMKRLMNQDDAHARAMPSSSATQPATGAGAPPPTLATPARASDAHQLADFHAAPAARPALWQSSESSGESSVSP